MIKEFIKESGSRLIPGLANGLLTCPQTQVLPSFGMEEFTNQSHVVGYSYDSESLGLSTCMIWGQPSRHHAVW